MRKTPLFLLSLPLFLLLAVLVLCPLVMVLAEAAGGGEGAVFTRIWQTLVQPENLLTIGNSLRLGAAVVVVATVIAAPLAWLLARTDMSRCRWLELAFMIPFMTPPYISSMGWILFMQRNGLCQQMFPWLGRWSEGFFSFWGLALVMGLHVFPFMLLMLRNAMLCIGQGLEDAGAVFGAGFAGRIRRIFLPLLLGNYAVGALLVFVKTLSEYGTPATLGQRIGFFVFTTDIHRYSTTAPVDFGRAATLSTALTLICLVLWFAQSAISRRHSYRLVGGKGVKSGCAVLRPAVRAWAWAGVWLVLLLSIGVPFFSVISTSLIRLRGYGLALDNLTFAHYAALFTDNPKAVQAILVSTGTAFVAATVSAVLGTVIAFVVSRSRNGVGRVLEGMSLLPEMLPGIVMVIGLMLFWNLVYDIVPLYNSPGMLSVAFVALFLPFTVQYVGAALANVNESLVAAARVFGASPWQIFRRVLVPLVFRGIAAGWAMTFIISFRELVAPSMMAPPGVLSISTFIVREFEQGSVSTGMAMAVICVLLTTGTLAIMNALRRSR